LWTAAVLGVLVLPLLTVGAASSDTSGPPGALAVTEGAPFEHVAKLTRDKYSLDSDPVDCGTPTDCWAFSGGLLRHTTDGGASWSDVSDLLPLQIEMVHSIACPDPTICHVAARAGTRRAGVSSGGIRVLTIRGDHVRQARLADDGVDPSIDCVSRTQCLLVDWRHSYVTADAGRTWTETRPADIFGGTLSCAPGTTTCWNVKHSTVNGSGTARRTRNFGASWGPSTDIGQLQPEGISCPAATTCFAVGGDYDGGTFTGVVATTTDGTTWTSTTVSGGATRLISVACATTLSCRIIGEGGRRTYAVTTDDGGATWRTRNLQITRGFQFGIDCGDTQACVGVSSELSLRTVDGGRTWSATDVPLEPDRLDAFTCATRSHCAGVYQDYNGDRYSIATDDGWRTWATHPLPRETGDISSIDCPTATVCHAWSPDGTDGGQSLVSHDGGTSWTTHQGPDTWRLSSARLSCPDANTCLAVGNLGGTGGVLRTTNGGATWQLVASPDTSVYDVACETVAFCVVLTLTTAYVTTDLGDQLTPYPLPAGRTYSRIDCTNRFCVAAGGRNRNTPSVIMSGDGGQTWLDAGTLGRLRDISDVDCGRGGACAVTAGSTGPGAARILATSDAGQSWELRHLHGTGTGFADHLSCVGDTCYAVDWGRLRSSLRVLKGLI
jgi:photosystem II stability/assembly factor-like uncharacterized protein